MKRASSWAAADLLIVTAANEAQAKGYRAQLEAREGSWPVSACEAWRVVPDAGGRRVGSGGSTLDVLARVAAEFRERQPGASSLAELFAGRRVIIVHSGGDSRRLAAYAAQGKAFVPLPCEVGGEVLPPSPFLGRGEPEPEPGVDRRHCST